MARFRLGGFARSLENFGKRLANIFAPSPEPQPPARREPPSRPERRDPYKAEWKAQGGIGRYKTHRRVFDNISDTLRIPADERPELWDSYLEHIVAGKDRFRRNSNQNMFWRDSGLDPRDFDWDTWREAMGYTGKRRSRTS